MRGCTHIIGTPMPSTSRQGIIALFVSIILIGFIGHNQTFAYCLTAEPEPQTQNIAPNNESIENDTFPSHKQRFTLLYQFPIPPTGSDNSDLISIDDARLLGVNQANPRGWLQYRIHFEMTEEIQRGHRTTTINWAGSADFGLGGHPKPQDNTHKLPYLDLDVYLLRFHLERSAGNGEVDNTLDFDAQTGFTEMLNGKTIRNVDLNDPFWRGAPIRLLMTQPGHLYVRNGALVDPMTTTPMLNAIGVPSVFALLATLMPPLPQNPVETSAEWKSSQPTQISMFAEVPTVPLNAEFTGWDEDTAITEIQWAGKTANLAVKPAQGIHHIKSGAMASVAHRGILLLNNQTGEILSSNIQIQSRIEHPQPNPVIVRFGLNASIEPIINEQITEIIPTDTPTPQ